MKQAQQPSVKQLVEAFIFTAKTPLSCDELIDLIASHSTLSQQELHALLLEIEEEFKDRGVALVKLASGYRFQTQPHLAPILKSLHQKQQPKFSKAFLETLALIAYHQPVTRADMENLRGVAVNYSFLQTMLERKWIQVVAYKDVPGRPALYATTTEFLNYFGLNSLDALPKLNNEQEHQAQPLTSTLYKEL